MAFQEFRKGADMSETQIFDNEGPSEGEGTVGKRKKPSRVYLMHMLFSFGT